MMAFIDQIGFPEGWGERRHGAGVAAERGSRGRHHSGERPAHQGGAATPPAIYGRPGDRRIPVVRTRPRLAV
jgi:hypothetical protein